MKKEVKSQAALEFLTTYAWAFLGILVVIGALYYFGIFDFAKFLPQDCIFPTQFECIDYNFVANNPTNMVRFKLINNIGEDIMIKEMRITNDAGVPLQCFTANPAPNFDWEENVEQEFIFSDCSEGAFIAGERTEAKISITYCARATTGCLTSSDVDHIINGKITSVVQEP